MILQLQACQVDLERGRAIHADGRDVPLTSRETDLLRYLCDRASESVSRDVLLSEVWGYADTVLSRACDNAVRRLRTKVEVDASNPVHLLTVHGTGYRFEPLTAPKADPAPAPPSTPESRPVLRLGDRAIDLGRHTLSYPGGQVTLSAQEIAFLEQLLAARGAVVDRGVLQRAVWGTTRGRAIDNAVARLRSKLEPDPNAPRWLQTERGQGYRLVVPERPTIRSRVDGFFGRAQDERRLGAALTQTGWVLLSGAPGVGKTRLARRAASGFRGPAWWVDASSATEPSSLAAAVAGVMDIRLGGDDPVATVGRCLGGQGRALLVLDNLEQVADTAGQVLPTWLDAAPELTVLGTSRIRLGLDRERCQELQPLEVDAGVELFIERARSASVRFRPDMAEVRALVAQLDGLPLAIELAASRTPILTPTQLRARLGDRLNLLARKRASTDRHRSLRAAIASSWDLSEPLEQAALLVLAMFRTGFDARDTEALLGLSGIDVLQALRDASWVHTLPSASELRFGVNESVRAFCAEKRSEQPDRGRRSELAWTRRLARMGDPDRLGVLQHTRINDMWGEHQRALADLEAAVDVALQWGDPETAAQCVLASAAIRQRTGPYKPTLARLDRVLASAPSVRAAAWMQLFRGRLLRSTDRRPEALHPLEESERFATASGDRLCRALGLQLQFFVLKEGVGEGAAGRMSQAAEGFEDVGRLGLAAFCRAQVEMFLDGDLQGAGRDLELAVEVARELGDHTLEGIAQWHLATLDVVAGNLESGAARLGRAAELHRVRMSREAEAGALGRLMLVLEMIGDHERIDVVAARALTCLSFLGDISDEGVIRAHLASSLVVRGRKAEARVQLSRARASIRALGGLPKLRGMIHVTEALACLDTAPARALALARAALAGPAMASEGPNVAISTAVLARCRQASGDPDGARVSAEEAVEAAVGTGYAYTEAITVAHRGVIRASQGDAMGAGADYDRATVLGKTAGVSRPDSELGVLLATVKEILSTLSTDS